MADTQFSATPEQTITLTDGRTLGYASFGHTAGPALLYFHGHPGTCLEAAMLAQPDEAHISIMANHGPEIVSALLSSA